MKVASPGFFWFDFVLVFLLLIAATMSGTAQGANKALPANASTRVYGNGWECDRGYRRVEANCVDVEVPADAHLNFSGHD